MPLRSVARLCERGGAPLITEPAMAKEKPRKKPETLRLRGITPSLTVNDIGASLAWYRDVVGFVEQDRWEDDGRLAGLTLKAGAATLFLTQDDFAKGRDRQKGVGMRLYCSTRQDVDRLAQDITARGGTLAHGPADMPWGPRAFALADPDGYQLTITSG